MADDKSAVRDLSKKPLTATERKSMETLIDNDHKSLVAELNLLASQVRHTRLQEVEEEFRDLRAEAAELEGDIRAEWTRLKSEVNDRIAEFRRNARERGVIVKLTDRFGSDTLVNFGSLTLSTTREAERDRRVKEVEREIENQIHKARQALDRNRLDRHRKLLMTGLVKEDTSDIIGEQPDVRDILVQAMTPTPAINVQVVQARAIEGAAAAPPVEIVTGEDAVPNLDRT